MPVGVKKTALQVAADVASKYGRETAAKIVSVVARERALNVDLLYAARLVGNALQPEFSRAVFQTLEETGYSLAAGRVLSLLRNAPPEDAKGVARWLSDTRPGKERPPIGREFHGTPYRVCDIAYNVLLEIQTTDKSSDIQLILPSQNIAEREAIIAPIRGQYPQKPNSANDAIQNADVRTPKTVTKAVLRIAPSNPVATGTTSLTLSNSNGWLLWASVSSFVAAAAIVLFVRWRRKKN